MAIPPKTKVRILSPKNNHQGNKLKISHETHASRKMSILLLIFLELGLGFYTFFPCYSVSVGHETFLTKLVDDSLCPLNFAELDKKVRNRASGLEFLDVPTECHLLLQAVRLVRSEYLQSTGFFTLPTNKSEVCWDTYQYYVNQTLQVFDVRSSCGVHTGWISEGCSNVSTRSDFESLISKPELEGIKRACGPSLMNQTLCNSCLSSLLRVQKAYFHGHGTRNVSDCEGYPFMFAAAFVNQLGPTDIGTMKCLFSIDLDLIFGRRNRRGGVLGGIMFGCVCGFLLAVAAVLILWRNKAGVKRRKIDLAKVRTKSGFGLDLVRENVTLTRFTVEELKVATRDFSREYLIGRGSYGNVFKGKLADGSEVALKRFKNCSVSGVADFTHEVEMIASVRHVNLLALRGYCTETVPGEGHQRVIVCDLMCNGSLGDHLFMLEDTKKLSWPIRRRIAIGTARGLAYLHYGVQPAIIHRDVKASNILLGEDFEPKLADFGLAKFTPEGLSHLSTKVAGTIGYVAPEYALYGKLTEKSDVYSFGVVLLELLSGRKAVISSEGSQVLLLADWAWSLVRQGKALDVIEESMPEIGFVQEMEQWVMLAVLSAHPLLYARPTMEQILSVLETEHATVSPYPGHPSSPLLANRDDN